MFAKGRQMSKSQFFAMKRRKIRNGTWINYNGRKKQRLVDNVKSLVIKSTPVCFGKNCLLCVFIKEWGIYIFSQMNPNHILTIIEMNHIKMDERRRKIFVEVVTLVIFYLSNTI